MRKLIMAAIVSTALPSAASAAEFTVSSADIIDGVIAQAQYGAGGNISPALEWTGAPEGTKSFVITIYDKDAPTGSGFWHWVLVDLPGDTTSIPAGAGTDPSLLPQGAVQTLNDASLNGYAGIAPPEGETHDYVITVKALGVDHLSVAPNATGAMVGFVSNMSGLLGTATLVAKGGN